ncbi:MAG: carbonic anhydrase family protein [Limnothrix sp.]
MKKILLLTSLTTFSLSWIMFPAIASSQEIMGEQEITQLPVEQNIPSRPIPPKGPTSVEGNPMMFDIEVVPVDKLLSGDDETDATIPPNDNPMIFDIKLNPTNTTTSGGEQTGEVIDLSGEAIESDSSEINWGYSGTENPNYWGDLSEDYKTCKIGRNQSPIDLNLDTDLMNDGIKLNYATVVFEVENNGHSIQVNYPVGSTADINGDIYNLAQFHFHSPSEHTVAGNARTMEVHLVHNNDAGDLAIISAMIEPGTESYDASKIWRNIPAVGATQRSGLVVNAANFLPKKDMSYVSYSGSLTTPPCSENVTWIVMKEPITLSAEQIAAFQALYPMNARPVQRTR